MILFSFMILNIDITKLYINKSVYIIDFSIWRALQQKSASVYIYFKMLRNRFQTLCISEKGFNNLSHKKTKSN